MTNALFAGSVGAAFAAGMVAFFAPCCSAVMVPTYLAAVGGGSKLRLMRLTALYIAGVSVVVLPITLGAAALASFITRVHPPLYVFGGLMMLAVAVSLWRGSMLPISLPRPEMTGSALSVFSLGAFSGAATACCAPVLAGAIALSATAGSIAGGLVLGAAYIAGLIVPLLPLALLANEARKHIRDPRFTLRLGHYAKRLTLSRAAGVLLFGSFGLLFIALAFSGNSENAPGFQKSMGSWVRHTTIHFGSIPNYVFAPLLLALLALALVTAIRRQKGARS